MDTKGRCSCRGIRNKGKRENVRRDTARNNKERWEQYTYIRARDYRATSGNEEGKGESKSFEDGIG